MNLKHLIFGLMILMGQAALGQSSQDQVFLNQMQQMDMQMDRDNQALLQQMQYNEMLEMQQQQTNDLNRIANKLSPYGY